MGIGLDWYDLFPDIPVKKGAPLTGIMLRDPNDGPAKMKLMRMPHDEFMAAGGPFDRAITLAQERGFLPQEGQEVTEAQSQFALALANLGRKHAFYRAVRETTLQAQEVPQINKRG